MLQKSCSEVPFFIYIILISYRFPATLCAFQPGRQRDSSWNEHHSFREFNQEKEKIWRAGSESAPFPLLEAAACPWRGGSSNPICNRRKSEWDEEEASPFWVDPATFLLRRKEHHNNNYIEHNYYLGWEASSGYFGHGQERWKMHTHDPKRSNNNACSGKFLGKSPG